MRKTNAVKVAVLVIMLGGAVYLALRQRAPHPLAIGDRAPSFSIPQVPSGTMELQKYQGQVIVVNLWATWCPPCVDETPSLVGFAEKMRDHGVVVLGVSVDENLEALREFVKKYHIGYPIGRDPDRALSARFGTSVFPETYIFDRRGLLAEKVIGPTDWDDPRMQNFVLDLARGAKP